MSRLPAPGRTGQPGDTGKTDAARTGQPAGKRSANGPVLAAGCVLWRRSERIGELEVCLVHRPRCDDPYDHKKQSRKSQVRGGSSSESPDAG
ncbi:hypothetical protein [Streptomyces sp. NPDC052042]|uniref:hypothetical protein n=1 Tax=Streptomyces sp. NPDC052042 TaxID=3365683 RepID=UPI0037D67362